MLADVIFDDGVGNETVGGAVLDEAHTGGLAAGQFLGEELGFVGIALLFIVSAALIFRGVKTAREAGDFFSFLLASGITLV